MDNIASNPPTGNPPDPIPLINPDPLLSSNRMRVFLGKLKGCKKIDHATLIRLVLKEGLPKHQDPFGSGHWCFLASEGRSWFEAKLAIGQGAPVRGPGRPRKVS